MSEMQFTTGVVLTERNQRSEITIGVGEVAMILAEGNPPKRGPSEPGTYEIDVETIDPNPKWPIVVFIIPTAHVEAFSKMPPHYSAEILRQASEQAQRALDANDRKRGGGVA